MGRTRRTWMAVSIALVGLATGLLWIGPAGGTHNRYSVDAVTIRVDRPAKRFSGKVFADSVDEHFCTSGGDWPVRLRLVRPGADKTVAGPTRPNYTGEWRLRSPRWVKGKRVYAEVPSYPNNAHGYCVGARSRIVRAP
jgi:hypothetical protein